MNGVVAHTHRVGLVPVLHKPPCVCVYRVGDRVSPHPSDESLIARGRRVYENRHAVAVAVLLLLLLLMVLDWYQTTPRVVPVWYQSSGRVCPLSGGGSGE
jgi:hypothetical protein